MYSTVGHCVVPNATSARPNHRLCPVLCYSYHIIPPFHCFLRHRLPFPSGVQLFIPLESLCSSIPIIFLKYSNFSFTPFQLYLFLPPFFMSSLRILSFLTFFTCDCICTVHVVRSLNLLTPTHSQLYFIKNPFKKLLHVSVYDRLQGVTISSLKSQLFKHSCMYTRCGGVAAYL